MAYRRFFRFTLVNLAVLVLVIGAFLSGRRTMQSTVDNLKQQAAAAELHHRTIFESLLRSSDDESRQLVDYARQRIADMLASSPTYEVVEVIDGVTIRVSMGSTRTVKLKGVDRPFGDDAKALTSSCCKDPVWLVQEELDSKGNMLAIVVSSRGDIISDELVRAGLAHDSSENTYLDFLEREARRSRRGLWEAQFIPVPTP